MLSPSLFLFYMTYFSSFIIVLSCSDWMFIWMGLEINMISFIMIIYNKYSINNIESCLKYFFIQSIGSIYLLMTLYLEYNLNFFISIILCYKIGGGLFYFWFPSLCDNISWFSCFMLMTFQKIIPLMLMSIFLNSVLWMMSLVSLIIGMMGSMNQVSMKRLLAFSSVHHIGWMMMAMLLEDVFWMLYLFIYILMMMNLIIYMNYKNIDLFNNIVKFKDKMFLFLMLINMGGIPPMLGFFLKWWLLSLMVGYSYFMMIFMVLISVIMLYIYFRLIFEFIMGGGENIFWELKFKKLIKLNQFDIIMIFSMMMSSMVGLILII